MYVERAPYKLGAVIERRTAVKCCRCDLGPFLCLINNIKNFHFVVVCISFVGVGVCSINSVHHEIICVFSVICYVCIQI